MKKNLRFIFMALLCAVTSLAWSETKSAIIEFGSNNVKINSASVTGDDNLGNTWTISTVGTTSFTPHNDCSQVGSSKDPATSITFTTTLSEVGTVTSLEAKFGGYSNTAGTVTLKVGDTTVGTGSLNGTNDVTVYSESNTSVKGTVLTVTVTGISKGVKCYYIAYTYQTSGQTGPIDPSVSFASDDITVVKGQSATNALSKPLDLTVAYSSSNTDFATVDASTGEVTGVAAGQATITASWNAVANKYNAGSASYTVKVIEATVYEKVTKANQLVAGNEYILVTDDGIAMSYQNSDTYRSAEEITISNNTITITDEKVAVLTLGGTEGAWTFNASDNNQYLTWSSENSLNSSDKPSSWIVTDDFTLSFASTPARIIQYNRQGSRFACYTSDQTKAYLYVKKGSAVDNREEATVTIDKTQLTIDGENATITTDPETLAVSYESSDAAVAEVSAAGVVTAIAEGTVTITATWAEQTINEVTYKAGSETFTIKVVDPNGKGSLKNPYSVKEVIDNGSHKVTDVWVRGYILDAYQNGNSTSLKLVASMDATDNIPVQLVNSNTNTAQKLVQSVLNVSDNPGMIGVEVLLHGNLEEYYSKPGFKGTDDAYIITTIGGTGYSTLYYGNTALEVPEGTEAYAVTVNGDDLTYTSVGDVIPAKTGVVLKGSGEQQLHVTSKAGTAPSANNLLGFDVASQTVGADGEAKGWIYYMLSLNASSDPSSVGFYFNKGSKDGKEGFVSGAHKAYLAVADTGDTPVSSFVFDDFTGVHAAAAGQPAAEGIYTISGVRVNGEHLPAGLYIVNGKKMIIK